VDAVHNEQQYRIVVQEMLCCGAIHSQKIYFTENDVTEPEETRATALDKSRQMRNIIHQKIKHCYKKRLKGFQRQRRCTPRPNPS